MSDDERHAAIDSIARNPGAGVLIGSGVRKVRFARKGSGKSGGFRIIHFFRDDDRMPVFLLTVFAKNEKSTLTRSETEAIRRLGQQLSDSYRRSK